MITRQIQNQIFQRSGIRFLSTRKPIPPKFGIIPPQPGYFNWKSISLFFAAGAALAYSEFIFEKYADFTAVSDDPIEAIKLDFKLSTLPLFQRLDHQITGENWTKLRSWENLDRNILDSTTENVLVKTQKEYEIPQLTNHTLSAPGGIAVQPVIFHNTKMDETITFVHMGYKLCGYPFIVHGGMLATLLNETFKRNASLSSDTLSTLKTDYKVENISITYKSPSLANQFFVVKTKKSPLPGSQPDLYSLTSVIESEEGKVLVEATATLRNTGRGSKLLKGNWINK